VKIENSLEAIALSIDQRATMALSDIRNGKIAESRQKFIDIQQAAYAALSDIDWQTEQDRGLSVYHVQYESVPLTVKLNRDGEMYIYMGNVEVSDLLLTTTFQAIERLVQEAIVERNTEY
jgi:hypothetical protein